MRLIGDLQLAVCFQLADEPNSKRGNEFTEREKLIDRVPTKEVGDGTLAEARVLSRGGEEVEGEDVESFLTSVSEEEAGEEVANLYMKSGDDDEIKMR